MSHLEDIGAFQFLVLVLAHFRLTHLVVWDPVLAGVRSIFVRYPEPEENDWEQKTPAPRGTGVRWLVGKQLLCYWCMGLWLTPVTLLLFTRMGICGWIILVLLALSAGQGLLEKWTQSVL